MSLADFIQDSYGRLSGHKESNSLAFDRLNLFALDDFVHDIGIETNLSFRVDIREINRRYEIGNEDYLTLRRRQNAEWARKIVLEGVTLAQNRQFEDAIKKYNAALDVDSACVDAMVARGAAYANLGRFEAAIKDHAEALKIQPDHSNAKIYLEKCLARKRELEEERLSATRGEYIMPLDTEPSVELTRSGNQTASLAARKTEYELVMSEEEFGPAPKHKRHDKKKKKTKEKSKKKKKEKERKRSHKNESDSDSSRDSLSDSQTYKKKQRFHD
ncbi:Tetratricopeptide repeat protein 14 [Blyttiomyces sp. JEL0837]|nr:Tetratricopeptide repeat protein 14 [Blyttiomyces sp. JEL0837]